MANGFIFNSPSIQFREKDETFSSPSLGITVLGIVGETQKGRAFEPTFVTNKNDFRRLFGSQSNEKLGANLKYTLPFYANSFLTEGNQMYVTRVLGLSGYDAGKGWALKVNSGLNPSSTSITNTITGSTNFSSGTYLGISINSTGTYNYTGTFTKTGTAFVATGITLNVLAYDSNALTGNTNYFINTITGSAFSEYEDMVVAVVRSRAQYVNNTLLFNASAATLQLSGAGTNLFGNFVLNSIGLTNESYGCNLDPDSTSFITNVIGDKPKGKNTALYVESVYPDLIKKLNSLGSYFSLSPTLVGLGSDVFTDYETQFQTPATPWVVSEVRGNKVEKLFRFISISDGDSANKEIKISIQRLNLDTKEFDVLIRDFNDTDDNIVVVESFTRCNLDPTTPNFIGKRIGSKTEGYDDFDFTIVSNYVYLEMSAEFPYDAFPCGFEGYYLRNYSATNTGSVSAKTPTIFYKTSYSSTDRKNRVYLGVSERGYDTTTNGEGINQNFFNYAGTASVETSFSKTKGFHLDSGATLNYTDGDYTIGEFSVGAGQLRTSLDTAAGTYSDVLSRKFTLVPYGGFDGWDVHRNSRTNNGSYVVGRTQYSIGNDYDAYKTAIETFDNPEETPLTLFNTAGINWFDQIDLVNDAIEMIERTRGGDALYVIDAPDMGTSETPQDIVDKLASVDIDSNYSCTYAPYIQINDEDSGSNVWLPPTGEVLRSFALTDKVAFPWYGTAGIRRGLIPAAKQVRKKFTEPDRDILYGKGINPLIKFNDIGVDIFGTKTLQIKSSALDRIGVRRLLIYAKLLIRNVAKGLIFEQNDSIIIDEFLAKVNPILANMQRNRGVSQFKVQLSPDTPEGTDRNSLFFEILIVPISTLEYLGITFTISPNGVQFTS